MLNKNDFAPARQHAAPTTGEIIRMLRELKGWTQQELSTRCAISATNISAMEHDRVDIGKRRAQQLARAFAVHPAVIMFPEFEAEYMRKAA